MPEYKQPQPDRPLAPVVVLLARGRGDAQGECEQLDGRDRQWYTLTQAGLWPGLRIIQASVLEAYVKEVTAPTAKAVGFQGLATGASGAGPTHYVGRLGG